MNKDMRKESDRDDTPLRSASFVGQAEVVPYKYYKSPTYMSNVIQKMIGVT